MSEPFVGEIRLFAGTFVPLGWAACDGQTMAISDNDTLFTLIGTTYGGDGQETFALPDLRGRAAIGFGQGPGLQSYTMGENGGVEAVTLTVGQIPAHGIPTSSGAATRHRPTATSSLAAGGSYAPSSSADTAMAPAGGSQPHENMPPFGVVQFIISLYGIYPSQG